MRKRMLSILLSLCMLFSLAPASVFAQDELEEIDECICETQCIEESINNDCPVCSKEGAILEDCRMYVPAIKEGHESVEENNNEESNTVVLENEEENNVSIITSKDVQDLIDALPDTTTINEDNVEEIEAQLEAIDNAKAELSDEELDSIDFTRYVEVATVLEQLLYGVQETSNQGESIRLSTNTLTSNDKEVNDVTSLVDALADSKIDVIKLVGDIDINSTLEIKRTVTLDLNGYVLKMTTNNSAVKIFNGGNLTLIDSNPNTSHFFDTTNNLWQLSSSGFEVLGGIITNSGQASVGSGLYIENGGSFTMNGGNIVGCKSSNSAYGGVYNEGTFIFNAGSIQGYAGGLYNKGTVNGNDGLITNYVNNEGSINVDTGANGTTFTDAVTNSGGIAGIFNGLVTNNNGNINGGTFSGEVQNNQGNINNGIFNNKVVNTAGKINGGTFNNVVNNKILIKDNEWGGTFKVKCFIYNGTFTETSKVSVEYCYIYDGTFKGKVVFENVQIPGSGLLSHILGGVFTETSELTALTNDIYLFLGHAKFDGIVNLEGSKVDTDSGSNEPIFGEKSTVYLNAGRIAGGIFYGRVIEGGATITEGAYRNIAFDTDGGSLVDGQKMLKGQKPTVPDNPTKTGYVFAGWLKDGVPYNVNSPLLEYITVKANWIEDNFTVKFDADGGSVLADKTNVKWNDKALEGVLAPTKTGYSFNGWKYNDVVVTENTKYSDLAGDSVPTSITLKADWNVNQYTITFDTDGGSVVSPITQDYGTDITKPSNPTNEGHTFAGWKPEIPDTMPSSNITIKAKWSVNKYTISFDSDGGSIVPPITLDYGSAVIAPISPTKVGYTFNGWDNPIPSTMPSSDSNIKALWKINKYTITFDTTGGSAIEAITLDYGSSITKPSNPIRSGYTFIGWDVEIPSTMPSYDMTIKAKWLDSEKPSGEIKVATNSWKTLLNSISFGLFFNNSQTVSISAVDNSNEDVKIEYLLSNGLLSITELNNQSFNLYTRPFSVNPNNEYVIYAKLTDTSNNISYISSDGLVLDDISPVVTGIESGKTYCEKKTVTVNDKYINSVKINGNEVTLDSNNSFILGYGKQNIIVTDKSGNKSEVNVTINNGHSFGGYNFDGVDTHTRKCNICGSSETYKCIDENKDHKCDVCNGLISKCVDLNKNHKCDICGKTISSHKGGEASCINKAICEICGQEYGELGKHLNLKHIEETKATSTSDGNKEYWYCEECNRYYSDKDGLNEISKEDTIIERLKDDNTNKDNNVVEIEHKDSNPIIWVVVPVVGVGIISGIILIIKRVKH